MVPTWARQGCRVLRVRDWECLHRADRVVRPYGVSATGADIAAPLRDVSGCVLINWSIRTELPVMASAARRYRGRAIEKGRSKDMQKTAIEMIEKQQAKLQEGSAAWVVGEQLKDMCRMEEDAAQIIAEDLQNESMSVQNAEKQIKAYADKHKTGNFSFVSPQKAEEILRKFYGLGTETVTARRDPTGAARGASGMPRATVVADVIELDAFL